MTTIWKKFHIKVPRCGNRVSNQDNAFQENSANWPMLTTASMASCPQSATPSNRAFTNQLHKPIWTRVWSTSACIVVGPSLLRDSRRQRCQSKCQGAARPCRIASFFVVLSGRLERTSPTSLRCAISKQRGSVTQQAVKEMGQIEQDTGWGNMCPRC